MAENDPSIEKITLELTEDNVIVTNGRQIQTSPLTKGLTPEKQFVVSLSSFLGFEPLEFLNLGISEEKLRDLDSYAELSAFSKYGGMSIKELQTERSELLGAISNEHLWQKGSDDFESIQMHEGNIAALLKEIQYSI